MLSYMAIGFGEPREVTRGRMVEVRTNSEDETEDGRGECREMGENNMARRGESREARWRRGGKEKDERGQF